MSTRKLRGKCAQEGCNWEGQLTVNGRMRSHPAQKGYTGPVGPTGNCGGGSDLPLDGSVFDPETGELVQETTASEALEQRVAAGPGPGPNPHRAPIVPGTVGPGEPRSLTEQTIEALAQRTPQQKLATAARMDRTSAKAAGFPLNVDLQVQAELVGVLTDADRKELKELWRCDVRQLAAASCVYPNGCAYPGEGCTGPCQDRARPDMRLMQTKESTVNPDAESALDQDDALALEFSERWPDNMDDFGPPAHEHRFRYGDDGKGHSGSFCVCGMEETAAVRDPFTGTAPSADDDLFASPGQLTASGPAPWVLASYDGTCDECMGWFPAGTQIRKCPDGWQCWDCASDAENQPEQARPRRVAPRKPAIIGGRYVLPHPETGKRWSAMRVTNFCERAADKFSLSRWEMRCILAGMALHPELAPKVLKLIDPENVGGSIKSNKAGLDRLAEMAKDLAGAKDKAGEGTQLHKWTENLDAGIADLAGVPEQYRKTVRSYQEVMEAAGFRPVPHLVERTTGSVTLGVVGTFDEIVQDPEGKYRVADKKSGSLTYGQGEMCVQLSTYATGINEHGIVQQDGTGHPDDDDWWRTWNWVPPRDENGDVIQVEQDWGLIIHIPQDGSECVLYRAPLDTGRRGGEVCTAMIEWGRGQNALLSPIHVPALENRPEPDPDAAQRLLARIAPPEPSPAAVGLEEDMRAMESPKPLTWQERFAAVRTGEEMDALVEEARGVGMPYGRLAELIESVTVAAPPAAPAPVPAAVVSRASEQPLTWQQRFARVTTTRQGDALEQEALAAGMPASRLEELLAVARLAILSLEGEPPF